MSVSLRVLFCAVALLASGRVAPIVAAEDVKLAHLKFTGAQSCSSTSCHGGGTGKNQAIIFERKDAHALAYGILSKGTSLRIAESLKITGDPAASARCNVCHSPMQAVPPERLVQDAKADKGVSCETCHGPAEQWLRAHTRPDVSFQQSVSMGMRDLNDLAGRANSCVACHLNLDEEIRRAGHPELFFELDGQAAAEPPHYRDERPWLGPRQWFTGQATALREMSWKLASKDDPRLAVRARAIAWMLRKTEPGARALPDDAKPAALQTAADGLAHAAAKAGWSREGVLKLLQTYVGLAAEFRDAKIEKIESRRRAEVLVPAIDRLWRAFQKDAAIEAATFETALGIARQLAGEQEDFDPARFAAALEQLDVALERASKP